MIFRRIRRQRLQPVATRAVAFHDSSDSIDDFSVDPGAIPPSLAPLPRVRLRPSVPVDLSRLIDSLPADLDLEPFRKTRRKVVAAALSRAYPRTYPRVFAVKSVDKFGATHRRALASFAEFNRLRADPRTAMCVRRRQRREVMFARAIAGRRGIRSYRRTVHSQWSC